MEIDRTHIFVSYSHKDIKWLKRLQIHLSPLDREGKLDLWDDTLIRSGSNWRSEIENAVNKASVAILLISADFLASDFINENELPPLLKRAKNDGAIILPLIVSPCRFAETTNVSKFQAVNNPAQPLSSQTKTIQEKTFLKLSKDVEEILKNSKEKNLPKGSNKQEGFFHVMPVAEELLQKIQNQAKSGNLTGLSTGLVELDLITSGFQASDLIIVAATPSTGLTSFGLTITRNASVRENAVTAIFSMEMSKESVVNRLVCSLAKVDAYRFRTAYLTRDEWTRIAEALGRLNDLKIFICDTANISVQKMRDEMQKLIAKETKLDLVVIDNLQLIPNEFNKESSGNKFSQISRDLKQLAKEFNIPVLVLCKLPAVPSGRINSRPTLFDLREIGSIEQESDLVVFLYREELHRFSDDNAGIAEINVAKHRNGPTRNFKLAFLREFTSFENYFENEGF